MSPNAESAALASMSTHTTAIGNLFAHAKALSFFSVGGLLLTEGSEHRVDQRASGRGGKAALLHRSGHYSSRENMREAKTMNARVCAREISQKNTQSTESVPCCCSESARAVGCACVLACVSRTAQASKLR